jgi:UDP-N-acetylglucosamine:LPS N-acetylglucosamine transferase
MAAADVVMGKAGPNTLFESVMLGKPFIASAYIPGQEYANLSFIQRHGLGWVALQPRDLRSLLNTLIHDTGQLSAMSATVNAYRRWNAEANQRVVPLIRSLVLSCC